MDLFNTSKYLSIMKKGFVDNDSQGSLGIKLFQPFGNLTDEYMDFDDSKISRIVKHKINPPGPVVRVASSNDAVNAFRDAFRSDLVPDYNSATIDVCCNKLLGLIKSDLAIPIDIKTKLEEELSNDKTLFLEDAFILSLGMENVDDGTVLETNDAPFVLEVNGKCPLCHQPLVSKTAGSARKHFEVVDIYNDDFSDEIKNEFDACGPRLIGLDNKIALCLNCASTYEDSPSKDLYLKLKSIREQITRGCQIDDQLQKCDIEAEIELVLKGLDTYSAKLTEEPLKLSPVKIKNKIPSSESVLTGNITNWVTKYYEYVRQRFSELDSSGQANFNVIASQVRAAFERLDSRHDMTAMEIFDRMARWICDYIRYPLDKISIVDIVVAFFVQNCEVFNEISE